MELNDLYLYLSMASYILCYVIGYNWFILMQKQAIVKQFFYRQIVHILSKHQNPLYYPQHSFNIVCCIIYIARFSYLMFHLIYTPDHGFNLLDIDFFAYLFATFSHDRDYFFILTFITLIIFWLLIERELFFTPIHTITWQKYADLVVENTNLYRSCQSLSIWNDSGAVRSGFMKRKKIGRKLAFRFDRNAFARTKLPRFPTLSVELRIKFVRGVELINIISWLTLFWICLTWNLLLAYYYHQFVSLSPKIWHPFLVLDLLIFSYSMIRLNVIPLLLFSCANICSRLYIGHIGEQNQSLARLCSHARYFNPQQATTFHVEHTKLSAIVTQVNNELWSRALAISLAIHIPTNVYLLYRMVYPRGAHTLMLSWMILSLQVGLILGTILPLAQSSRVFHQAAPLLPRCQQMIPPRMLHLKWSYLCLYERLNSHQHQYGITVGPSGTTTYKMIFELFLIYFAFVFKVFDFFLL